MKASDKRVKVNKIVRLLVEKPDDFYSESTLDRIISMVDTSGRVVDLDEELKNDFDE